MIHLKNHKVHTATIMLKKDTIVLVLHAITPVFQEVS